MPSTMKMMCLWNIFGESGDATLILISYDRHNWSIDGGMGLDREFPEDIPIIRRLSPEQNSKRNR